MSAMETAVRMLRWAAEPTESPPPIGDLDALEELAVPPVAVKTQLAQLARVTAARLSIDGSLGGEAKSLSAAPLWLAAAAGAPAHPQAGEVIRCCPLPAPSWELVARDAVVAPILASGSLPDTLGEALLGASPLTELQTAPARGNEDAALSLLRKLLARRDLRRFFVHLLATPSDRPPVLEWRGRVLATYWLEQAYRPFVLDVYETASAAHTPGWAALLSYAQGVLDGGSADEAPSQSVVEQHVAKRAGGVADSLGESHQPMNDAPRGGRNTSKLNKKSQPLVQGLATYWDPMRVIRRAELSSLRQRSYLDYNLYLAGVRLAAAMQALRSGVPS